MFRIGNTILSEEIATAKFACDVTRCKGACCVVGESGAPVSKDEIPVLKKAFRQLEKELTGDALDAIRKDGLIQKDEHGSQLACTENGECVFVNYTEQGVAECIIQRAWFENRFDWEKPISCHLYPVRLKNIAGMEYANFEYIPDLCSSGCENGNDSGTYLSDFLERALVRRYGQVWYKEFEIVCNGVRKDKE